MISLLQKEKRHCESDDGSLDLKKEMINFQKQYFSQKLLILAKAKLLLLKHMHLFAREVFSCKKHLEIQETKTT